MRTGPQIRPHIAKFTLDHFFEQVTATYSDQPSLALVGQTPVTYRELAGQIADLRQMLRELHIHQGDKVVILGRTSPNWAIAFLAITTMGAVVVPVLAEFPEADIDHIVRHVGANGIFIAAEIYHSMSLNALDTIYLTINLDDFTILHRDENGQKLWSRWHDLPDKIRQKWSAKATYPELPDSPPNEDDLAEILFTSGTTGHSKGVMLTHRNIVSNILAGAELLTRADQNAVLLTFLPLAHAFASTFGLLAILYMGASVYFLDKKPTPKLLMDAMQQVRPTILGGVPLIFEKIYRKRVIPAVTDKTIPRLLYKTTWGRRLLHRIIGQKVLKSFGGRLQYIIIGGSALNHDVEMFMRDGGLPYICGYGLSECSPLVSFCRLEEVRPGAVGKPVRDVRVKIVDPDPETGIGEIYVKGPNVMKGYYNSEAATRQVFTDDGWLITGDRGRLDADGYLFIKGRSKNVIIGPNGENIYPEIIEDKLIENLEVEEALVYEDNGQIQARIYPDYQYLQQHGAPADEGEMARHITRLLENVRQRANKQLPGFSRIHKVMEQREPFIKSPTNKIRRGEYVRGYAA